MTTVESKKAKITASKISPNIDEATRGRLMSYLGISKFMKGEKYLGLPMIPRSSKVDFFGGIKERISKMIQGWKERFLSKAGRETLIKSIAQVIPTFAMSCFMFPKLLLKDIKSMVANFWWGHKKGERKMHRLAWKKFCRPKGRGGMGFRDLYHFNMALLAKQGGRIMQNEGSLVARIMNAQYFPSCSFLEAPVKKNCSFLWRSIASLRHVLEKGSCWRVGDGQKIRIWHDPWVEGLNYLNQNFRTAEIGCYEKVEELIFRDSGCWKEEIVRVNFEQQEAENILKVSLCPGLPVDRLLWKGTALGLYTVKSGYQLGMRLNDNPPEADLA